MRIYNRLLIFLSIAFGAVNVLLAVVGQQDISVYFILDAIAYLIIVMLYVYLNPRARRALNTVSVVIFAGFLVIVTLKVIEILK